MVSLAFHLFVVSTVIFALYSYDFVHSFVADSNKTVVIWCFLLLLCFFHLMLAGRQPFGVLGWFQLFCLVYLVEAACLPD